MLQILGIDEIQALKLHDKDKSLSLFHINVPSLDKIFDNLEYLLKSTNKSFDILQRVKPEFPRKLP